MPVGVGQVAPQPSDAWGLEEWIRLCLGRTGTFILLFASRSSAASAIAIWPTPWGARAGDHQGCGL